MENVPAKFNEFVFPLGGHIRVVIKDDEPWFVASDVAEALGYALPQKAVLAHCRKAEIFKCSNLEQLRNSNNLPTSRRGFSIIPESDVYRLTMRSNLPTAEAFQDWVCDDVIPSIRKTGMYGGPKTLQESLRAYADLLDINERNARLALEAQARVAELADNLIVAEAQRDKAIREKAQINCSRVGTCMRKVRTANEAKRKVEAEIGELKFRIGELEIRLGEAESWKTVAAMDKELRKIFRLDPQCRQAIGRKLTSLSVQLGMEPKKVPDVRFGEVKSYHVKAWEEFFKFLFRVENAEFMGTWRKD